MILNFSEFGDEGTEMGFELEPELKGSIITKSSGNKKQGLIYILIVNGKVIEESTTS